MPTLETANLDDFIAETGDNTIYFWGVDQPLQNEKNEPVLGLLIVMSSHDGKKIIRCVENLGITSTKNEKDIQNALNGRIERIKTIQKTLAEKGKGYATGLWSNE